MSPAVGADRSAVTAIGGIALRAGLASKERGIARDVAVMLGGDGVVEVDCGRRAFDFAGAAVDAFIWVDEHLDAVELATALGGRDLPELIERNGAEDAVAGADVDARGI